jgi:glycosyltransferase
MLVSIITVCYNRAHTIEHTIKSVLEQDYPNIEYIIIDGNSSDGSQNIISKYKEQLAFYLSEPDTGMYHALNKGISQAKGEIIGLMHSDDEFYDSCVVSNIVNYFKENTELDGIYGNGHYLDNNQKLVRDRKGIAFSLEKIKNGWLPLHPTVYLKKSVYQTYGDFDTRYSIASDSEFLLRILLKHKINIDYLNNYIVQMKIGGLSTNVNTTLKTFIEDFMIYKNYVSNPLLTILQKKSRALQQYLTKR